jgi:hypothetical protein
VIENYSRRILSWTLEERLGGGDEVPKRLADLFHTFALANAVVTSAARVEARAGLPAREALSSNADSTAFITGPHTQVGEWGRIGLNLDSTQDGPDIILRAEAGFLKSGRGQDSLDGVFVSFLDSAIDAEQNFADVIFRIENEGDVVLERLFDGFLDAELFFSSTLDLGDFDDQLDVTKVDLRFILEQTHSATGAQLGTYFAVGTIPVPEPGTGILVAVGLVVLASRRRRGSQSR